MGVEISAEKLKNNRMKSRVPEVNKPIYNCLLISFFFFKFSSFVEQFFFFIESDSSESEMLFILRSIYGKQIHPGRIPQVNDSSTYTGTWKSGYLKFLKHTN